MYARRSMDRIVVIANPAASQFTGGAHREVMSVLSRSADVEAIWPGSAAETEDKAREAVANGVDGVVAMGGDGMVHHVSQGVVETESALGIIPVGTTNVFARLLGIPPKPVKAARLIAQQPEPRRLGVAEMQLRRGATETRHIAVFSCGFGLDAAVVREADKDPYRKYRFGSLHYASTAFGVGLKDFPKRKPHVVVSAEGKEALATTALIQLRSVYTYFGRMALRLAPGLPEPMTVLTVGHLKRRRIPRITLTVLRGGELKSVPELDTWPGVEEMFVEAEPPVEVQADGESLGMVDGGSVRWLADSLKVVAPQLSP